MAVGYQVDVRQAAGLKTQTTHINVQHVELGIVTTLVRLRAGKHINSTYNWHQWLENFIYSQLIYWYKYMLSLMQVFILSVHVYLKTERVIIIHAYFRFKCKLCLSTRKMICFH